MSVAARILERGYAAGVFRRQADAIDVHLMVSAFCFFRMPDRHTFRTLSGRDMVDPRRR